MPHNCSSFTLRVQKYAHRIDPLINAEDVSRLKGNESKNIETKVILHVEKPVLKHHTRA